MGTGVYQHHKPGKQHIKLIKSIQVCRTPALGGVVMRCKDCGARHYIYKSCGHSHCMLCQSIKCEQWMDRLNQRLLKVHNIHTTLYDTGYQLIVACFG
ncbi:MAG: transposase zinc-binding domain-containing protein [Saprospiraceae bacterium]|nr:transposase zinc-binding domain-containing protein [Saprospiraceae bacterium]